MFLPHTEVSAGDELEFGKTLISVEEGKPRHVLSLSIGDRGGHSGSDFFV